MVSVRVKDEGANLPGEFDIIAGVDRDFLANCSGSTSVADDAIAVPISDFMIEK